MTNDSKDASFSLILFMQIKIKNLEIEPERRALEETEKIVLGSINDLK